MANIRVWTSKGQWSEDVISGLDKVDLIKAAILHEYNPEDEDNFEFYELSGLEIDHLSISSDYFEAKYYIDDINAFCKVFESRLKVKTGKGLESTVTLKVRLSTIKEMAKHIYLSAAYNAIIEAACVPSPTPVNYCLLLKFE